MECNPQNPSETPPWGPNPAKPSVTLKANHSSALLICTTTPDWPGSSQLVIFASPRLPVMLLCCFRTLWGEGLAYKPLCGKHPYTEHVFSPGSACCLLTPLHQTRLEKDPLVKSPVKGGGGFPEDKGCPHTLPKTTVTTTFSSAKARSSAGAPKPRP